MNDYSFDSGTGSMRQHRSAHASGAQTLHRQPSRQQFESFGGHQSDGVYGQNGLASRFENQNRSSDRYGGMLPPGQNGHNGYEMSMPQAWNNSNYSDNHLAALGATTRRQQPTARGRPGLPSGWLDQVPQMSNSNGFPNLGSSNMSMSSMRSDHHHQDSDEDLIPTAIVIKNIPFAVKKEQLVQVMTDMHLPLPYAFNYHFDNGVFRGLAFANFTTADETAQVINAMNHLDLHGRKLRVEYKKMLPQAERDRIEREKRERRGQLEEQHRPMAPGQLQSRASMSSLQTAMRSVSPSMRSPPTSNFDMNDPLVLTYFSKLLVFQNDPGQGEVMTFSPNLPAEHRKLIHGLAHQLNLGHESQGLGDQRQVHVFRTPAGASPPDSSQGMDPNRRGLYRAATTNFDDVRDPSLFGPLGRQASGYLGFPEQNGTSLGASRDLRGAKSFADMRSYSPSPSHPNASFPAGLANNVARYSGEPPQTSPGQRTNGVSPAPLGSGNTESILSGLGNLSLNPPSGFSARAPSPQRLRPMMSWDRGETPGPIGGHRSMSANQGDLRNGVAGRQPRIPMTNSGFSRRGDGQSSRGSDELSSHHNGILESVVDE